MAFVKATLRDVMDSISKETFDFDGVSVGEWVSILKSHDDLVYDLMVLIAKNRSQPAFKELVFCMEAAIDAELWDREHEVSGIGAA